MFTIVLSISDRSSASKGIYTLQLTDYYGDQNHILYITKGENDTVYIGSTPG